MTQVSELIEAIPGPYEIKAEKISAVCWIAGRQAYEGKDEHTWVLDEMWVNAKGHIRWYCSRCRRIETWSRRKPIIDDVTHIDHILIDVQAEPIEVTRSGLFGGPVDYSRKFIAGVPKYTLKINDLPEIPITDEQSREFRRIWDDQEALYEYARKIWRET
jgi:hypothetical protein